MYGLLRKLISGAVLASALSSCVGPGFQAEGFYGETRPDELKLYTTEPRETQSIRDSSSRRGGVRIAIGGPEFSARGYAQLYGETMEVPTTAGGGEFDNVGIGIGALGRQRLTRREPDQLEWIIPYRIGLNYAQGSGKGQATPTGTFGDLEYLELEADLGLGISLYHIDLVAGGALRRFDGKAEVLDGGQRYYDGLRGTNFGPYLSLAYSFGESPWRLEARAGFGDLEEYRIVGGFFN